MNNGAGEAPQTSAFTCQVWSVDHEKFGSRVQFDNGTNIGISGADVSYIAIGEAPDNLKTPKVILAGLVDEVAELRRRLDELGG